MSDSALAFEQLRLADGRWESALRASALAPPDPGFAGRIRAIASAAEQEAAAFRTADAAGLAWPPLPAAREMNLSYELRRGGRRPGPVELWERFDAAVAELGTALEGVALSAIARTFSNLADIRPHPRRQDRTHPQPDHLARLNTDRCIGRSFWTPTVPPDS